MSLSTYLLGNTDLETIDDLRALLKSDELYKNNVVFDLLCGGLESGSFKGVPKKQRSPLVDLITVAHEAHFRLELYYALGKQCFRHQNNKEWQSKRREHFIDFIKLVFTDRFQNEKAASTLRCRIKTYNMLTLYLPRNLIHFHYTKGSVPTKRTRRISTTARPTTMISTVIFINLYFMFRRLKVVVILIIVIMHYCQDTKYCLNAHR